MHDKSRELVESLSMLPPCARTAAPARLPPVEGCSPACLIILRCPLVAACWSRASIVLLARLASAALPGRRRSRVVRLSRVRCVPQART